MGESKYFIFEVGEKFDLDKFEGLCFELIKKYKKNIKELSWKYPSPDFENDGDIIKFIQEKIELERFKKDGSTGPVPIPFHKFHYPLYFEAGRLISKEYGIKENKNYIKIFYGSIAPSYEEPINFIKEVYSIIRCSGAGSTDYDWYDEGEKDSVNYYTIGRLWSINLFSKKDVEKYGRKKLLESPAQVIEELPDGAIFMMINKDSFSSTGEQREKLRKYLKDDLQE